MSAEFIIQNHALIQCKQDELSETLTIPDGVEKIMTLAFLKCQCKEIIIPPSVKFIEYGAFQGCRQLERITIPSSVKTIKNSSFYECHCLKEVTISEGITEIPSEMFECCEKLETVHLPESLQTIGTSAFARCRSLKEITIPNNVSNIGSFAFLVCDSLRAVHFPKSLAFIGMEAFGGCISLKRVEMPKHIGFIGKGAFQQKNQLYFPLPEGELCVELDYQWCEQRDEHLLLQFINTNDLAYREKIFSVLKTYSYRASIALWMVEYYPEQKIYQAYVRRSIKRIMENFITANHLDRIEKLLAMGYITKKNIDHFLEFAIKHQQHEIYLTLLNYKNEVVGYRKNLFRL